MSRQKFKMSRFMHLLCTLFVVAAAGLTWGSRVTYAERVFSIGDRLHPYAIRDKKVDPKLPPAARARAQRAAAIKRKQDTQKFILDTIKAEQSTTSGKGDKGVAP